MENDELKHYGVRGMKWGVRKNRYNSANSYRKKATEQARKDYDDRLSKIQAKTVIKKAGSKQEAIKQVTRSNKIEKTLKKGALAATSLVSGAYGSLGVSAIAKASTDAYLFSSGAAAAIWGVKVTALTGGLGAVAIGTGVAAAKYKTSKLTNRNKKKVDYIKKSR